MKIKKGTLVLIAFQCSRSINSLALVEGKSRFAEDKPYVFRLRGNDPRQFREGELIPLAQTNPKKIRTVGQALKAHPRTIISNLIPLTNKARRISQKS